MNFISTIIPRSSFLNSVVDFQKVLFSKYISKSRTKRLPLTTKRVGKGYNKGYGARRGGFVTRTGNFKPVKEMQTELVVPDLTNFKLKPYVAPGAKRHIIDLNPQNIKMNI